MSLVIRGIGTATPPRQIAQVDAASLASSFAAPPPPPRTLAALYRQTRIHTRGSVLLDDPGTKAFSQSFFPPATPAAPDGPTTAARMRRYAREAGPLAIQAAGLSLENAGIRPADVTHLITCSCTGFASPGIDIDLIQKLGLPATVGRTHVGFMGCHGAFNALKVADAIATADRNAVPLTVCVELCSLHFQYGSRSETVVPNSIFADGAAAAVGSAEGATDRDNGWHLLRQWSALLPDCSDEMTWVIGDHGFEMSLAATVPLTVERHLPALIDSALADVGLMRHDIGSWGVHPGGPRILDSVERAFALRPDDLAASWGVLTKHGNMSSATILFILDRLWRENAPCPCLAMAFGPGITVELGLFTSRGR